MTFSVVVCDCLTRRRETTYGDFRLDGKRDGWVFKYRDAESPNAHHVLWRNCPWCGELLPGTSCVADLVDESAFKAATKRRTSATTEEETQDGC
jgi:hypothetical protein